MTTEDRRPTERSVNAGSGLARGRCDHCGATMLVHDGTTGEVTCQMCARTWECDRTLPGHDQCGGRLERYTTGGTAAPRK